METMTNDGNGRNPTGLRRIEFDVDDLPPKKDGATSMWGKRSESDRLRALRRKAAFAFKGEDPLSSEIHLELSIWCPNDKLLRCGDLDNFITGVCDGLMACSRGTPVGEEWSNEEAIHPRRAIGMVDDSAVLEINARKHVSADGRIGYRVVLVGR
jgi:hypothetical protein